MGVCVCLCLLFVPGVYVKLFQWWRSDRRVCSVYRDRAGGDGGVGCVEAVNLILAGGIGVDGFCA